ncbi:MAG: response regulator, partial [Myxococcales bacterium]|nr:response regulator [Myxococcales bacterium]
WWVGNAVGGLVLAPVVLRALLDFRRAREVPILRWAEAAAFMAVVVAITHAVFSGSSKLLLGPILVFPLLLWGSIRMGPVGVGVAAFLMVLVANHDTAANVGPFASPDLPVQSRIIALQLYAAVAVTSFQILALAWEERVDRDILHEANVTLQRREEQLQEALLAVQQAQARAEALADAERVARSEVERVSRVKDEFLATLSHELRTPLNAALGWAQILLQQDLQDGSVKRGVTVIERNTRAQARLIDDLLEMSRINSGKLRLELETVSLRELVGTVVDSFRPSAEARKLRLSLEVRPPSDTFPARVDVGRLQQVVSNIVGNAIKFTPDGGSVALVLRREAAQIELAVSDTGRGIPSEFLPQVFDRFRQADGSTTRRHGGLGLGMSIASRLTEMHGGSLVAVSEGEGRGATFTLSLPAATDAIAKPAASATTGSPLGGRQLLVVDDDSDALEMMDRLLAGQGCSVERAASAKEALARLSDVRPDVLLSDISMPEMDGYELMR